MRMAAGDDMTVFVGGAESFAYNGGGSYYCTKLAKSMRLTSRHYYLITCIS